ncbi:MarR family winged helix-turn-helix transcriptional regulator [Pseudomonas profundi]|uniref:MarR family winged helix-turn-helix transcriptional regulator n=1 Tax=Pseudomonas profundi TaxID=1981513 RepID=UPI00123992D6|nr:MarR family transcriptional regulator [Pseudomonas profundi]
MPNPEPSPTTEEHMDYDFTSQIGYLLRRAYQRHTEIFQKNAYDPQLTSTQFVTLCALHDNGPSSQTELTRATSIDQGTIRGLITRLEKRHLVELKTAMDDKRKVIVHITDKGEALYQSMLPSALQISELTASGLNQAERVALFFLLKKMTGRNELN